MNDETLTGQELVDAAQQDRADRIADAGARFEVVGPEDNEPGFANLIQVTLRSTDGATGEPVPGMELMVPDAANLKVFRGVPIEQVRAITLDGARWIEVIRPTLSLPPGQGKVLTAEVLEGKGLSAGDMISVGVAQIIAFKHSPFGR